MIRKVVLGEFSIGYKICKSVYIEIEIIFDINPIIISKFRVQRHKELIQIVNWIKKLKIKVNFLPSRMIRALLSKNVQNTTAYHHIHVLVVRLTERGGWDRLDRRPADAVHWAHRNFCSPTKSTKSRLSFSTHLER